MKAYTEGSFACAINKLADELIGDLILNVEINLDEDDVEARVKNEIYLITREAITNIKLHAEAERAEVRVDAYSNRVSWFVQDDGRGFCIKDIAKKKKGITRIQKHVANLGGTYEMNAYQGDGVAQQASIPLPVTSLDQAKLKIQMTISWDR